MISRDDIKFPQPPVFRNPEKNGLITQALFLELNYDDTRYCLYTLKEHDCVYNGKTYPSIKQLYLEIADPTEYQFAKICFEGWAHWKRMCEKTNLLKPYIEEWREELQVRMRSLGVKTAIDKAMTGDFKAGQWLADKGFVEDKKRGRPSQRDRQNEKAFQEKVQQQYGSDIDRLKNLQ